MGIEIVNMRAKVIFFLLFLVGGVNAPICSHAQLLKKIFGGGEEKRPVRQKPTLSTQPKQAAQLSKKKIRVLEYPASKIKNRYRIDILLPLYLSELVQNGKNVTSGKLSEKAAVSIGFYEGIKLAADSLNALGYQLDIFVHDVTEPGLRPDEIVKSETLNGSDLIIGALQSNQLLPIAEYAKAHEINFISSISPSDAEINDNLFFTMLQPTLRKHVELLKTAANKRYPNRSMLLLYRRSNMTDSLAAENILINDEKNIKAISIEKPLLKNRLERSLDSLDINVLFLPIVDVATAESTLNDISTWFPNYQFEIYGLPSWRFMPQLKKADVWNNLRINFTSPFYFDLSTPRARSLANGFRAQFSGKLTEMVFRGYDVLFWYGYLLHSYGTVYNTKQSDNSLAPFTKFDVKLQWNQQKELLYNENNFLYFYRYQSGSFVVNNSAQ